MWRMLPAWSNAPPVVNAVSLLSRAGISTRRVIFTNVPRRPAPATRAASSKTLSICNWAVCITLQPIILEEKAHTEVSMALWTQLPTLADTLADEKPAQHFLPVRPYECIHERGYSVCSCGKLFPDIRSKSMHQIWC